MPDLPALDRLTRDVARAMRDAEARAPRRRRLWPLVGLLLAVVVPTAIAVESLRSPTVVDIPGMRAVPRGMPGAAPTGRTVVLATGDTPGRGYTFVAQRCGTGDRTSLAIGYFNGRDIRRSSGGFDRCAARSRPQPRIFLLSGWTSGSSWMGGIVRADIATVTFRVVRKQRRPDGTSRSYDPRTLRVRTQPFPAEAARAGRLPTGFRYVLLRRSRRSDFTRLVARDAAGRVVVRCERRACDRISFGR